MNQLYVHIYLLPLELPPPISPLQLMTGHQSLYCALCIVPIYWCVQVLVCKLFQCRIKFWFALKIHRLYELYPVLCLTQNKYLVNTQQLNKCLCLRVSEYRIQKPTELNQEFSEKKFQLNRWIASPETNQCQVGIGMQQVSRLLSGRWMRIQSNKQSDKWVGWY